MLYQFATPGWRFSFRELPRLQKSKIKVIINIAGDTEEDYVTLTWELLSRGQHRP